jgi:predicted alpha-1,6-mannanase (GH76 family)
MMDEYYPNTAWLCLSREVFDRLHQYKIDRGLPTWEQAVESMLP